MVLRPHDRSPELEGISGSIGRPQHVLAHPRALSISLGPVKSVRMIAAKMSEQPPKLRQPIIVAPFHTLQPLVAQYYTSTGSKEINAIVGSEKMSLQAEIQRIMAGGFVIARCSGSWSPVIAIRFL